MAAETSMDSIWHRNTQLALFTPPSSPGLTRRSIFLRKKLDHRVTALRAGPVMTTEYVAAAGNDSGVCQERQRRHGGVGKKRQPLRYTQTRAGGRFCQTSSDACAVILWL